MHPSLEGIRSRALIHWKIFLREVLMSVPYALDLAVKVKPVQFAFHPLMVSSDQSRLLTHTLIS